MSDTLTDTTGPAVNGSDADEKTAEYSAHGRHRGRSAADDRPESDPHGRHRAAGRG
ncbi:hypothetical protein [Streptomyces sp. NRRL S-350]|uniref:hypothetical protein n=1 Tax=Streptomyces sp. NRRL S-350 TaxID=1463902 RepID=UPI000A47F2EB|nr:hypothetical protein [Streptomyces sp. NRRL S-350]